MIIFIVTSNIIIFCHQQQHQQHQQHLQHLHQRHLKSLPIQHGRQSFPDPSSISSPSEPRSSASMSLDRWRFYWCLSTALLLGQDSSSAGVLRRKSLPANHIYKFPLSAGCHFSFWSDACLIFSCCQFFMHWINRHKTTNINSQQNDSHMKKILSGNRGRMQDGKQPRERKSGREVRKWNKFNYR